jgi:uncharacterized protein (TIGR02266 family)
VSAKTILIAHRQGAVRDRFAAALADARHGFVMAADPASAERAAVDPATPIDLLLVDLGLGLDPDLAGDGVALVRRLRDSSTPPLPVVVFAGSVTSAAQIAGLLPMRVSYVNEHATTAQILPALAPLLFPDNFNRRASPRVPLGVPISYRVGTTIVGAVTLDVGRGGLAIRTMTPLPKGTAVHLKFRLPGIMMEVDAAARVAWSNRATGMGVQFERVSANDQRAIDKFVEEHGAGGV